MAFALVGMLLFPVLLALVSVFNDGFDAWYIKNRNRLCSFLRMKEPKDGVFNLFCWLCVLAALFLAAAIADLTQQGW